MKYEEQKKKWNKCMWLAAIAGVLGVIGVGSTATGIIGLSQGYSSYDIFLLAGLTIIVFGLLILGMWHSCQYVVKDDDYMDFTSTAVKKNYRTHRIEEDSGYALLAHNIATIG